MIIWIVLHDAQIWADLESAGALSSSPSSVVVVIILLLFAAFLLACWRSFALAYVGRRLNGDWASEPLLASNMLCQLCEPLKPQERGKPVAFVSVQQALLAALECAQQVRESQQTPARTENE